MKVYQAVPFNPNISEKQASKQGAELIAKQLQDVINEGARSGWTFESYETVMVAVNSRLFWSNFGAKSASVLYGTVIFSRSQVVS